VTLAPRGQKGPAHRLVAAVAVALLTLLLAACTITSDRPLIADGEGSTPLPDAFTFVPYDSADNGYAPSKEAPVHFARQGDHYSTPGGFDLKGPIDIRFVPIADGLFLMQASVAGEAGILYGFARYADGVLAVELTPDQTTTAALAKARVGAMPQLRKALAGLRIDTETDAITVLNRSGLDLLVKLRSEGKLPLHAPSIAFISLQDGDDAPARLVPDGTHWVTAGQ